jgi:uncharacterized membrane protein YphA (DoxX/SURF4 family)
MIDPLIVNVLSVALGLLLVAAAWHKLSSLPQFTAVVADYQLLPQFLVSPTALIVPLAELVFGLAWLTGFAIPWIAPLTAGMFALYAVAIAINLVRGRLHISCGCGLGAVSAENQHLSWVLVLRNTLLVAVALLAIIPVSGRSLGGLDWLTLSAALIATGFLYLGGSQLLQNGAAIRSWRNPRD